MDRVLSVLQTQHLQEMADRRRADSVEMRLAITTHCQLEPGAVQHLPDTAKILLTSGLLPAALIAIVLNLLLPEELAEESTEEVSGGLSGSSKGKLPHTPKTLH